MVKNVIIYRDSYDIESVLPFSKEVNDIDLEGMIGFTRVNLECDKNSDYLSMIDTYVVGIPYRCPAVDKIASLNKDYLLEQDNKNKNLSEEFKEIQESVKEAQKYSSETNASEVFRYQLLHTNNGKILYSIEEVESNHDILSNINDEQKKAVSTLIKNKDKLHLISINVETGIAIDQNHEIIVAELNEKTHQYEINRPLEYQYDTETVNYNEMLENMDLLDIDSYDIVITDDVPTIVNGENLDPSRVKFFYEYPEALNKQTLSQKERFAYLIAIKKFRLMKEEKRREIEKNDTKRYVKVKKNLFNQTGFTNTILLSLLTGFAGGVITTIMYMVIK